LSPSKSTRPTRRKSPLIWLSVRSNCQAVVRRWLSDRKH
jgi:hypothetical protein